MGERNAGAIEILVQEMCRSKTRKQVAEEEEHAKQNEFFLNVPFFIEKDSCNGNDSRQGRKDTCGIAACDLQHSRIGECCKIGDQKECFGAETPKRKHHARHSKQSDKEKVKCLNSGYHGAVKLKVMKTTTINIHNQSKRVLTEKCSPLFMA